MINKDKWINSLTRSNRNIIEEDQINPNRWIKNIPKKNDYISSKRYILTTFLFVGGLLLVSIVKNETRNIQKEINNLESSINDLKHDLSQSILDNEVITSPGNISKLAKEYLNNDFIFYKKSQIKDINNKSENITTVSKLEIKKNKNKKVSTAIKEQIAKKIDKKKSEIKVLQNLYSDPKSIPGEVKTKIVKSIENKKKQLKKIYNSPREVITLERTQRWAAVQIVKLLLGMPVIPGK